MSKDADVIVNPTTELWIEVRSRVNGEHRLRKIRSHVGGMGRGVGDTQKGVINIEPSVVHLLLDLLAGNTVTKSLTDDAIAKLREYGVLVPPTDRARNVQFQCLLDTKYELPSWLPYPARYIAASGSLAS